MSRKKIMIIGISLGIVVVLILLGPAVSGILLMTALAAAAAAGIAWAVKKLLQRLSDKTGRDIGRKKTLVCIAAAEHIMAVLLMNIGDRLYSVDALKDNLSHTLYYTGSRLIWLCVIADIIIVIRYFISNNADRSVTKNGKVNLRGRKNILAVLITLVIHLLAVWSVIGGSNSGGLEGVGYFVFFLIFGGISVAIDTIWLVRVAKFAITRSSGNGMKKLFAIITVLFHLVFLSSFRIVNTETGFFVFGISLIVCGVLDIVWIIHGIKSLYSRRHSGHAPKKLLVSITAVLNITAAVIAKPALSFDSQLLFYGFIILASICIVIDMIWLVHGWHD